jgi:hypothetical protein
MCGWSPVCGHFAAIVTLVKKKRNINKNKEEAIKSSIKAT